MILRVKVINLKYEYYTDNYPYDNTADTCMGCFQ